MMDLGHVRSFAEVAERGTVAAAAASLGFTPPAVSQHIAKLETELAAKLFDRVGRRLRLTTAGVALLPAALAMIDLEAQGRAVVAQPVERPHIHIAGFASAIASLVVPHLPTLTETMTIEITESEDADALRDLRLGAVDLVLTQEYLGHEVERDPRMTFTPLLTDQLRLVMPAHMRATTTVAELGSEPWLVNGTDTRCTAASLRILAAAGLAPRIAGNVADNTTLLAMVAAGHGVTIVPEVLLAVPRLGITVAMQDLGVSRTIYAVNRATTDDAVALLLNNLGPSAIDRS